MNRFKAHHTPIGKGHPFYLMQHQRGLTLIELMISIVIGLVIVGGVLSIFVSTSQTAKLNDNLMRVQENARGAFDVMARDIREAGQNPCGSKKIVNVIRDTSANVPWWSDWNGGALRGFEEDENSTDQKAFGTSNASRVLGTDALIVMRSVTPEYIITGHADTEIDLATVTGLNQDDVVFACDGANAAIFQIGTVGAGSWKHVSYDKSFATLNCTNDLGDSSAGCDTLPAVNPLFTANGILTPVITSFWYVGYSDGQRSLFRKQIRSGLLTDSPDEVVPGVQDLQITYLTRDGTSGALATNWTDATAVTDWAENSTTMQVVAVKLDITLQTTDKVSATQTPIQRHLIHVVGLRNRDVFIPPEE